MSFFHHDPYLHQEPETYHPKYPYEYRPKNNLISVMNAIG